MTETETVQEFGTRIAREKKWIFHPATGAVGIASEFFDGDEKVFVSQVNGFPVKSPIIQLDNGHALLMRETSLSDKLAIFELTENEVGIFLAATHALGAVLVEVAKLSAEKGVIAETAFVLMRCALQAQIAKLQPKTQAF